MSDVSQGEGRGKVIVVALIVVALIATGVAIALTRDDDGKASTSSEHSSSGGKGSGGDTGALLAKAKAALLAPTDLGSSFETTPVTEEGSFPCNGRHYDDGAKPAGAEQVELDRGTDVAVVERVRVYSSELDAEDAFAEANPGYSCRTGTVKTSTGSFSVTILSMPTPFGGDGTDEDLAATVQVDSEDTGADGLPSNLQSSTVPTTAASSSAPLFYFVVFAARVGQTVIVCEFYTKPGTDTSGLPALLPVVRSAIAKFNK